MKKYSLVIALFVMGSILSAAQSLPMEDRVPIVRWEAKASEELPLSVDNNRQKFFPPVISQLGGSCAQASNIGYMFTYEMNRLLDEDGSLLKNRYSYLYSWNFINDGWDNGTFGVDALQLAADCGIMNEEDFPRQTSAYQFRWASGYDKYYRALHHKVKKYNSIYIPEDSMEGIQLIKQYLYNKNEPGKPGGIVTFSSQASGWKFDSNYSGPSETGYRCLLIRQAEDGPHAMTITGYDDLVEFKAPDGQVHKGAFIVTNTHGTFSQDQGKFYLPYWFFLQKREESILGHDVFGVEVEYVEPQIVFKVGLDYNSRNDLSFRIGVSEKSTDTCPMHDYVVGIACNQGGDFPMQGYSHGSDIEFGFDFTSHVEKMKDMEHPTYFLTVLRNKRGNTFGEGKMISFEVYDYREDINHPKIYKCADIEGKIIQEGENIFSINTKEKPKTSYSPVQWLNQNGQPVSSPLLVRTAGGKFAKIRLSDYDRENGKIRIKYVYAPDGSRKLK